MSPTCGYIVEHRPTRGIPIADEKFFAPYTGKRTNHYMVSHRIEMTVITHDQNMGGLTSSLMATSEFLSC